MKTICFFGIYDPEYSRNRVLMRGFRENGWDVVECRADPKLYRGARKYVELVRAYARLSDKRLDLVLAAFPGQTVVWLARLLFPRTRVVFDAFTSLYDSNVSDRALYGAKSFRGRKDFFLDWQALKMASLIITDTAENARYLRDTFGSDKKMIPVFVGTAADAGIQADAPSSIISRSNKERFIVHFHGSFIPLQGIEYIIRAARLFVSDRDVLFRIIGDGQEYERIIVLSKELNGKNVEFLPRMPFIELMKALGEISVSLGIFGTSDKVKRVIPNKLFEALAAGKAVITADSPACRELLADGKNVVFCKAGDPDDLAEKIRELKADPALLDRIARGGHELSSTMLRPADIVGRLIESL
jgi:glycosyltransferase involved in cell wall biosynthesis